MDATTGDKVMANVIITIKRTDGTIDSVSAPQFGCMDARTLDKIRIKTRAAGRGEVLHATYDVARDNARAVHAAYNNLHNEGGEGYTPDPTEHADYKMWTDTITVK